MAAKIDIGDQVTLTGTFTTAAGALVDPTTVVCKVRLPDLSEATPAVTHVSLGVYTAVFAPTQSGEHWYRFAGTGAAVGAEERAFVVERQQVP
jgi:hypothetical protein